ncbi:MAG: CotH kinase family protein [Cytophagales bacterium]|nr:CotH kinase family protein [Cytophagales bacterium]
MKRPELLLLLVLFLAACKKNTEVPVNPANFPSGPENSDLPFFAINTDDIIPDEPKINGEMVIFQNQEAVFTNGIGIELRGATSRRLFPKKSYGVELWDANGLDMSRDIFGFGSEEDWILQGPYADKTLMRNVLIYDISNNIGQYAVKTAFSELTINDVFRGTYVFMERIKRDGDRLDLERLEPNITDETLITGAYILKIDKTSGDTEDSDWPGDADYQPELGFRSPYDTRGQLIDYPAHGPKTGPETYFLYEYPSRDEINDAQKNYIQQYIMDFEEALIAEDYTNEPRLYEAYIDVPSFIDFFILNELSGNPDGYRLSTYMHKDRGQKLKMGPIWDFNLAFGNDGRSRPDSWVYRYNDFYGEDLWLVHFWWPRLLNDPIFRSQVKTRWQELRGGVITSATIHTQIDDWVDYLDSNGALDRNFREWPVIGETLPFNSFVGESYEEEINYLKNWIDSRITWMDSQIANW